MSSRMKESTLMHGGKHRWPVWLVTLCLVCAWALPAAAATQPLQWQLRSPQPTDWDLVDVAYGNNRYVALALDQVYSSQDGKTWTGATLPTEDWWPSMDVVFAEGSFYVVDGNGVLFTSKDGKAWTRMAQGMTNYPVAMAYGAGNLVAVGDGPQALPLTPASPTAPVRSREAAGPATEADQLREIVYGAKGFVALGSGLAYQSVDGRTWSVRRTGENDLNGVAFGAGRYVAVGGGGVILTSADGLAWAPAQSPTTERLQGVTYGGGKFVAVGDRGVVLTSADGLAWTASAGDKDYYLRDVVYGGNQYLALGEAGRVITSPDGNTWTDQSAAATDRWLSDVAYTGAQFVAVGDRGTVITSPTGEQWTARTSGTTNWLTGVAAGGKSIVAVGERGTILSSADGVMWTARQSGVTGRLTDVVYGNQVFVAVGAKGTILTSADGSTWKKVASGTDVNLLSATYWDGVYFAAGEKGTFLVSVDNGQTWKSAGDVGTTLTITGVAAGRRIVVLSTDGSTFTIANSRIWRDQTLAAQDGVAFAGDQFVLFSGTHLTVSSDGQTWTEEWPDVAGTLQGIAYGAGRYVVVGSGGLILTASRPQGSVQPAPSTPSAGSGQPATGSVQPCESRFADVPATHPACNVINWITDNKVISPYPDGRFGPEDKVSKVQLAYYALQAMGLKPDPARTWDDWATKTAIEKGLFAAGTSGWYENTTRGDVVTVVTAMIKLPGNTSGTPAYSDLNGTMLGLANTAYRANLIGPNALAPVFTGATLEQTKLVTRAELAMVLYNFRHSK